MKIAIVTGSHRHESQSARVGRFVEAELHKLGLSTYFCSLADTPLPLWDEGVWEGAEKWKDIWGPISKELREASAFVVISPEWRGMAPAGLKNFFLLCGSGSGELAHKAALLVGVSSGLGGSYPIAELRMSSYKNTRICYLPEHLLVRNAEKMLQGGTASDPHDESLRKRMTYSLKVLQEYAKALDRVRASGVIDAKTYPNGM